MPPVVTKDVNAVEKYQAEVNANPKSADAHANLGWGHYGRRQWGEAITAFQAALALDARHFEAHYGLGLARKATQDKAAAIAAFQAAKAAAESGPDPIRRQMLTRLITGHINELTGGDWNLGKHETHA